MLCEHTVCSAQKENFIALSTFCVPCELPSSTVKFYVHFLLSSFPLRSFGKKGNFPFMEIAA